MKKSIEKYTTKVPSKWRWVLIPLFLLAAFGLLKLIEYSQTKWESNQEKHQTK